MESSIPAVKSNGESGPSYGLAQKKKASEITGNQSPLAVSPVPTVEKEQERIAVLPKSFSRVESKLDTAMKNQISSSRAITVEIDTLRDIMPKLRKEIQTYSINECLLIKELERKLPSCQEHKDVRLDMVLEEIQRLRMNRRKTLSKLKESIVKVVELQSRMEVTSYEAGEIFWDGRISRLSSETYHVLDDFAPSLSKGTEEEKEEDFSPADISNFKADSGTLSVSVKNTNTVTLSKTRKYSEQGYAEQTTDTASHASLSNISNLAHKTAQKNEYGKELGMQFIESPLTEQLSTNKTETAYSAMIPPVQSLSIQSNPIAELTGKQVDSENDANEIPDIEMLVSEAQKQAQWRKLITRKGIMLTLIPPAVVAGLLVVDWLTGIVSKSLSLPFG